MKHPQSENASRQLYNAYSCPVKLKNGYYSIVRQVKSPGEGKQLLR